MLRSRLVGSSLGLAALGLLPGLALAQEEAGGGSAIFSVNPGLIVWTWVLFLLTLGILAWKVFPAISGGLEDRHDKIQASIDEAHRAREEAKSMLAAQQSALEEARRDAQDMIERARSTAEGTRKEILAEAKQQQEAFLADARKEIGHERDRLREDLRREAVEVSLAAAERLMRKRLDAEENRRLVEELVGEL